MLATVPIWGVAAGPRDIQTNKIHMVLANDSEAGAATNTIERDANGIKITADTEFEVVGSLNFSAVPSLTLVRTNEGQAGPQFIGFHETTSPAADDDLFDFIGRGRDSAANQTDYAEIHLHIGDPTSDSEEGEIHFHRIRAGAEVVVGKVKAGGWLFLEDPGTDTFQVGDGPHLKVDPDNDQTDIEGALVIGTGNLTLSDGLIEVNLGGSFNEAGGDNDLNLDKQGGGSAFNCDGATGNTTIAGTLTMSGVILGSGGSAAAPSIVPNSSEADMGIYSDAAQTLKFTFGGSNRWNLSSSSFFSLTADGPFIPRAAGAAGTPTYSFLSNADMGMYPIAANRLGFSTDNTLRLELGATGGLTIAPVASEPTSPGDGLIWFDSTNSQFMGYNGTSSIDLGANANYAGIYVVGNVTGFTITTANTYQQFVLFDTAGPENLSDGDITEDHIEIAEDGDYRVCGTFTFSGSNSTSFRIRAEINNGATTLDATDHCERLLSAGGDIGDASFNGMVSLSDGDTVELWITSTTHSGNSITIESANFNVQKMN